MITGNRLVLRAWEKTDLEAFTRWFNDPEVTIYLSNAYPCVSTEQEERYMAKMADEPHKYSIVVRETGQLIGNCNIHSIDLPNRSAELGIVIGEKESWSQGYGREALGMLLEIGFEGLGLNRVGLRLLDINERGYRCYCAAGFHEEGRLRQNSFVKGVFRDDIVMSVLASEYWSSRVPPTKVG
jgi:RimJ/RimL family protein N-acetyltransferase